MCIYIYSGNHNSQNRITAVRTDMVYNEYRGSRNTECIGIEIGNKYISNTYHHKDKLINMMNII
jgi:hypothetical protein